MSDKIIELLGALETAVAEAKASSVRKLPEPQLWAVQVRRDSYCTVYVKCIDPVVAREIALREADDFVTTETAIAYTPEGRIDERYWHGDSETGMWVYPETELFDEGEK